MFNEKYDLPSLGKLWSAITQEKIELDSCSNTLKTWKVL